jgi:hypothetical protein
MYFVLAKERFTNKLHILLSAVPCSMGLMNYSTYNLFLTRY